MKNEKQKTINENGKLKIKKNEKQKTKSEKR